MTRSARCLAVHLFVLFAQSAQPCQANEAGAAFSLTAPKGGAQWSADSQHYITWEAAPVAATSILKIEWTTDGGKTWQALATTPNNGRYLWKVPNQPKAACLVRITSEKPAAQVQSAAAFAIVPSREVKEYAWTNVTAKAAFAPRDGAGALAFRGRLWFLGGWNPGDRAHFPRVCNNEVWSSSDGAAWTLDKPNTFLDQSFDGKNDWEGRHTAGYVVFKDKMWIVGGDVNQGHYHFDIWNSDDGKRWTQVNANRPVPWGPRALHYTVVHQDMIWVIGGQTVPAFAAADEVFYRDIWNSSDGITWKKVAPREPYWPQRGMIGGSAVHNGRIWILGGGTYDTPKIPTRKFFNDVWSSADGVTWEQHTARSPWEPRQYHDVAVYDGRLWVMEGYGGTNRNDVWYADDGVNWYEVPNTPWAARHAASVFVHSGALWMVAGNNMTSDVWKLRRQPAGGK